MTTTSRPRSRIALALPALLGAALLGCSKGSTTAPASNAAVADVYTPGNTFSPFSLSVPKGTTVRFNIFGENHNVIFDRAVSGAPTDINVVKDVIVTRQFTTGGTFSYLCTVHPGMTGEIVVM
jgi:plastocyanin